MQNNASKGSSVIFIGRNKRDILSAENIHKPLVSFIIPILNAEKTLKECLDSILSQNYPNIEIILVGNGSIDDTYEIAKFYERKYGEIVKVFRKIGPLGNVRTYGIEKSSGELIALWDSDLYIPHTHWLIKAVANFNSFPEASTLWIRTTPPNNSGLVAYAYDWISWTIMLGFAKKGIGFWGGGCSIFRREAIKSVGGITRDIDTGEDYDLARKLAMKGHSIVFYDDPVYHDSHKTLSEIIKKDLRRSKNFKRIGLSTITGISFKKLLFSYIKVGIFISIKNLFMMKKPFFGVVPIIVLLRFLTYFLMYVLYYE
ncbi:MAG: glycosyltransferase family 2 protein [Nitrososphaeria archaeon]